MANKNEKAQVDVIVNGQKANASIKDMEAAARALRAQWRGLKTDSPDFKKVDNDLKNLNKKLSETKGASAKMKDAFSELKGLLPTIGLATLVSGLINVGKQMFQVRSEFQKYEAVLKNTLGSETLARQSMNMLQKTATMLPVSVKELTDSFVKLANRGFVPTQKEIIKLNDIASSTGKSLDMFVEAILDAQTGEFERLKEFGIRAKKEGDKVTFTFKGQKTQVDKTDEAIKNYLLSLGELKGVAGSSAAIMNTFAGQVSNIGDSWDNLLNNMGKNTEGFVSSIVSSVAYWVDTWAWGAKSIKQIQDEVYDEQAARNFENAMKEIDVISESLIKQGMTKQSAQTKAAELYRTQLEAFIATTKEELQTANNDQKKLLEDRIKMSQGELDSVNAHFLKQKELEIQKAESAKDANKKSLEDQQKYINEVIKSSLSETERENIEYEERKQKVGNNQQALEILAIQHKENLEKIEKESADKIKAAMEKHLKDEIDDYDKNGAEILRLLKERYIQQLEEAGNDTEKRKAIEEKYNKDVLVSEMAQLQEKKILLQSAGSDTLAIEQQITDKKLEILQAGWDKEKEGEKQTNKDKLQEAQNYISQYSSLIEELSNYVSTQKDAELTQFDKEKDAELEKLEKSHKAGLISDDNYEKKKNTLNEKYKKKENDLRKKYAEKEFILKIAQIGASTASGIMNAFASLPPYAAIIASAMIAATGFLQTAAAKAEFQKVKQLAKGQYNITGATDGQNYTVPFDGPMQTGMYNRPVLVAERGNEMVIDNPTLRNIQFNAPDIIPRIMANRVKQYADGNYPDGASKAIQTNDNTAIALNTLAIVVNRLNSKLDNLYAKVLMDEFKQVEADWNNLKSDVAK